MLIGFWLPVMFWFQLHAEIPKANVALAPEWEYLFRRGEGWIGADCAYSVPLDEKTVLWLFDDTWFGEVRGGKRVNAKMVIGNSIAIQVGRQPQTANVRFIFGKGEGSKPTAFVTPPDGLGWFWFGHGVVAGRRLWLFLWQIEPTGEGGVFGFRLKANWLAEIPNFTDSPEQWQFNFHRLPFFQPHLDQVTWFGSAVWREGDWVYIYGGIEDRRKMPLERGLITARVPAERFSDFSTWQFLSGGRWVKDWRSATPFGTDLGTEFSVSYLPSWRRYVMVYSPADLAPVIKVRYALKPTGPWSEASIVYWCPDPTKGRSVFCYGAKGHPELSAGDELLVTYVTNSFELAEVLENAQLYFPRFIRLRFSKPGD